MLHGVYSNFLAHMARSTSLFDIILLEYSDEYTIRSDIDDRITLLC